MPIEIGRRTAESNGHGGSNGHDGESWVLKLLLCVLCVLCGQLLIGPQRGVR